MNFERKTSTWILCVIAEQAIQVLIRRQRNQLSNQVTTFQPNDNDPSGVEFGLWTSLVDYFAENRWNIDTALARLAKERTGFQLMRANFMKHSLPAGVDTTKLRDPGQALLLRLPIEFLLRRPGDCGDALRL